MGKMKPTYKQVLQQIARLQTADEYDDTHNDEGMPGDDAVDTLSNVIDMARSALKEGT